METPVAAEPLLAPRTTVPKAEKLPNAHSKAGRQPPKGDIVKELAARLVTALKNVQERPADRYPINLRTLATSAGSVDSPHLLAAVRTTAFTSAVVCPKPPRGKFPLKLALDLPVAFWDDLDSLVADPSLVSEAIRLRRSKQVHAFSVAELKNWLSGARDGLLQKRFDNALKQQIASGSLPENIGWIQIRSPKLFLLDDLKPARVLARLRGTAKAEDIPPSSPAPAELILPPAAARFADRFEIEFSRLDRQTGSFNLVPLLELRRALAEFPRDEFDRGLKQLRQSRRYRMNVAEGRAGVSPEQQQAAIIEDGTIHSSVSRVKS